MAEGGWVLGVISCPDVRAKQPTKERSNQLPTQPEIQRVLPQEAFIQLACAVHAKDNTGVWHCIITLLISTLMKSRSVCRVSLKSPEILFWAQLPLFTFELFHLTSDDEDIMWIYAANCRFDLIINNIVSNTMSYLSPRWWRWRLWWWRCFGTNQLCQLWW